MSNWPFLNSRRVSVPGYPDTDASWGFNGAFKFSTQDVSNSNRAHSAFPIFCIASDGDGWQHVSVSLVGMKATPPKWDIMCLVKDLFWESEDAVVQIHPKVSDYVNYHPGCLHLWRCTDGREQPLPPWIMVGPKPEQIA